MRVCYPFHFPLFWRPSTLLYHGENICAQNPFVAGPFILITTLHRTRVRGYSKACHDSRLCTSIVRFTAANGMYLCERQQRLARWYFILNIRSDLLLYYGVVALLLHAHVAAAATNDDDNQLFRSLYSQTTPWHCAKNERTYYTLHVDRGQKNQFLENGNWKGI